MEWGRTQEGKAPARNAGREGANGGGGSAELAAGLVQRQERLAGAHHVHVVVLVGHLRLGLALEQVVVLEHLVVALADFFLAREARVLHAFQRGDHGLRLHCAGLEDPVDQQLGADVRARQAVVGVGLELLLAALDQVQVQRGVHGVPVLRAEVDAVAQVRAQRFELLQPRGPGDQDGHVLVHAEAHRLAQRVRRLRAEVQQQQHVGLGGHRVGEVAAEFLLGKRVVAVAHVLQPLFLEDVLGGREQAVAEHVLRRDGVPALGFGQRVGQRAHGLLDGAEGGNRPAERGGVAVLAGDLVGARGGDEDAAGLFGLLAHGQRFGRQDAAREEARALLLRCLLHLAHGGGGLALGVEHGVGQWAAQGLAVLLDGQLHAQVGELAVRGEGARHGHGATELDRARGLCPGFAREAQRCGQRAQCGELQEVTTLHGEELLWVDPAGLRAWGTVFCKARGVPCVFPIYSDK